MEAITSSSLIFFKSDKLYYLLKIPTEDLLSWRKKETRESPAPSLASRALTVRPFEPINGSSNTLSRLGPFDAKSMFIQASSRIENKLMMYFPLLMPFPAVDAVLVLPDQRLIIYAQAAVSKAHPIKYLLFEDISNNLTERSKHK